jgi:hypothetical protein
MEQLHHLPMWMKQLVFVRMRADLEPVMSRETLETLQANDCLQMMVPQLSRKGSHELLAEQSRLPQQLKQLLQVTQSHSNVASICVTHQWTLEQCCANLLLAYKFDLLMPCANVKVDATIRYLGNETRIGEYLVQIGRLSWDQLDQALRTLNYIQDVLGERTAFGEVAINLGFVTRQECEAILFLKEESKKAFDIAAFYQAKQAVAHPPAVAPVPLAPVSYELQPEVNGPLPQTAYYPAEPLPAPHADMTFAMTVAPPAAPAPVAPPVAPSPAPVAQGYGFNGSPMLSMGNSLVPQGALPMPHLSSPAQASLAPPPLPHLSSPAQSSLAPPPIPQATPPAYQAVSAQWQQQPLPTSMANGTKQAVGSANGQQALVIDLSQNGKGTPQANGANPPAKKGLFGLKF